MTIGEDRNKDRFKNWKLCVLWNLPFRNHGAKKLTQNWVCFTNPCINLFVLTSVTCEYHSKVLEHLHLLQCFSAHLQETLPWASSQEILPWARHNTSIFLVLFFVPVWSHASENRSNACWRPCWEDPRMQHHFVRKTQTVHPAVQH